MLGNAYGRLGGPYGDFAADAGDALKSLIPSISGAIDQATSKSAGQLCSQWSGEVVKWQNTSPSILHSKAQIAAKLAEAKAEKARTCQAATDGQAAAQAYLAQSSGGTSWASAWASSPFTWGVIGLLAVGLVWSRR